MQCAHARHLHAYFSIVRSEISHCSGGLQALVVDPFDHTPSQTIFQATFHVIRVSEKFLTAL